MCPQLNLNQHPSAKEFNSLTPDSILHAVESQGRRCTGRSFALNSYENRVYQLELDDKSTVVGKFYRPGRWNKEQIQTEHSFLRELSKAELPVASPLELAEDQTIGQVGGIYYGLFHRMPGRIPEELSADQLRSLGGLLARIHQIGAQRDDATRPALTPTTYGWDNLAYLLENNIIVDECKNNYCKTVELLLNQIEPLFADVKHIRIHGDCHRGNLLWAPDGFSFLDFDDMLMGPAVQDIWLLTPSFDNDGQHQRDELLAGYTVFRSIDRQELNLVEPLRALRYLKYTTWIAKRWQDPSFQRTFPHFGTLQYWEKEIQDLREQLARINQHNLARQIY